MKKKAIFSVVFIVLLASFALLVLLKDKLIYETSESSQTVELFNGDIIELRQEARGPRFFSIHPFIVHGGFTLSKSPWIYEYRFKHNGNIIHWESQENWLLLNLFEGEYYAWAIDRSSRLGLLGYSTSNLYRYDQSTTSWVKLERTQFPKAIAVKNLNLSTQAGRCDSCGIINEKEIVRNLDLSNHHFNDSETAHLWLFLETGTHLERAHWDVDSEVLRNFKEEYIKQPVPIIKEFN